MELKQRDTQTQVKHMILAKYLDTWGGIVFNALRSKAKQLQGSGRKFDLHFVYVDCFAYKGRYSGDSQDILQNPSTNPVSGSPIIGIRALDKLSDFARKKAGIDLRVNAILIEEDRKVFADLLETLSIEGLIPRTKKTTEFSKLKPGEIAVVNGDSVALMNDLLGYTTVGFTWAFYLLDDYGASGIPYDFVQSIVQQDHHDVMINFPYLDLQKKSGMIRREEELQPAQRQLIDHWTNAFGSEAWKEIVFAADRYRTRQEDALWGISLGELDEGFPLTKEQPSTLIERQLVNLYRSVLRGMDSKLAVKLVDLQFPLKERTMFYLFLTTHDPTGALSLNEILAEAKLLEYELRYRFRFAKKTAPPPGQLFLFTEEPNVPEPQAPYRPTEEEVAEEIIRRFAGQILTRRDVYRELADEIYFPKEVDKALRFLKKKKRASFADKLTHNTSIKFSNS